MVGVFRGVSCGQDSRVINRSVLYFFLFFLLYKHLSDLLCHLDAILLSRACIDLSINTSFTINAQAMIPYQDSRLAIEQANRIRPHWFLTSVFLVSSLSLILYFLPHVYIHFSIPSFIKTRRLLFKIYFYYIFLKIMI